MDRKVNLPLPKTQPPPAGLDPPKTRVNIPDEDASKTTLPQDESSDAENAGPATPHTLLSEDPFSTEASRVLFDSIDKLRDFGAGQELDLPQLVIVGKQSAGKSSLLQSLTDIPFPVDDTLCTRFATRIISKRTDPGTADTVKASIELGDVDPFGYKADPTRVKAFEHNIPLLTPKVFEALIDKAKDVMGINSSGGLESQNFSSMVLKIELQGPGRSHFGILDLPGIFSAAIGSVKRNEIAGVTALVSSYIKRENNIIICVADAADDLHNQGIFNMSEEILEKGNSGDSSRFIGVFTKCDRSQRQQKVVQTVLDGEGIKKHFLQWFVVRNAGPKDPADFNREAEEFALFSKNPWSDISPDQRGTRKLKTFLANTLCRRICKAFPDMQEKIKELLQTEISNREGYGSARLDHSQRLAYLTDIVKNLQDLSYKALKLPGELPTNDLKLRGITEQEKDRFTKDMTANGHLHQFLDIGLPIESYDGGDAPKFGYDAQRISINLPSQQPASRNGYITPSSSPPPKLPQNIALHPKIHPLYAEIKSQMATNRGEELPGMLNPAVLKPLWKSQTSKWQGLSEKHLNEIISITEEVTLKIFHRVSQQCALPARAASKLEGEILEFSRKSKQQALSALHVLCHKNANMALQTTNPDFQKRVRESQQCRFKQAIQRYSLGMPALDFIKQKDTNAPSAGLTAAAKEWAIVDIGSMGMLFNEMHPNGERAQNTEDEIHDILRAYYDISIHNFLYDINHNIIEPFLTSSTGPLLGLSTDYVLQLSEAEVEDLGGEDEKNIMGRRNCEAQIGKLERASRVADEAWRLTRGLGL